MYGSHVQNYVNPKYYATKENSKWEINLTGDQNDHSILNDAKKNCTCKGGHKRSIQSKLAENK